MVARSLTRMVVLGSLLWLTSEAVAQNSIPQEIITASRPLTASDAEKIEAFLAPRVQLLGSGDGPEVARVRNELVQPPRAVGATDVFRRAYADALRDDLRPIFAGTDEFRTLNALSVLPFLFTAESLDELAENASRVKQSKAAVRIGVCRLLAQATKLLASSSSPYSFNPAQADSLVRKMREAADQETEWLALAQLATAISHVAQWKSLPAANAENARTELLTVLKRELDLAQSDPASETMRAVHATLLEVRKQVIDIPVSAKANFAKQLNPLLKQAGELATAGPPPKSNESLVRAYEQVAEMVKFIRSILAK